MKLVNVSIPELAPFSLDQEAVVRRDNLLAKTAAISAVTTADEQELAVRLGREIQTVEKDAKAARETLARPLLEAQRLLKSIADEFCEPLESERKRLSALVAEFQLAERQRAEEEARKRRDEIAALGRQQAEAEQAAANLANAEPADADAEAVAAAVAAAERAAEEAAAAAKAAIYAPPPAAAKAEGMALRKELRFEVTDIHALYAARPDLCKLEPSPAAILERCVPGMEIPGLKLWWEHVAVFRRK